MNLRGIITAGIIWACSLGLNIGVTAAEPDISKAAQESQILLARGLETQFTNAFDYLQKLVNTYNAKHSKDQSLDELSPTGLRMVTIKEPGELAPKLLFLSLELTDEDDCERWLRMLKSAYMLATNDLQKITCLVMSAGNTLALEQKTIGRKMLGEMAVWLKQEYAKESSVLVAQKLKLMIVLSALGLKAYEDVTAYAIDTPFRAAAPLWMMSKGKWELALQEVIKLRKLPDLTQNETAMLDGLEPIARGVVEKKSAK